MRFIKYQGNAIVCRFLQWFHTQKKDGANFSSLWLLQRNSYSHNDALQKRESHGSLTWWWHRLLCHCCWSSARRYISTIYVYNLPRLRTSNFDRSNRRKWLYTKKGKKQTIPSRKLLRTQLCNMTKRFLQIHQPKLNPCCIVQSRQHETLASTWMQTKQNTCVFNREGAMFTQNGGPL